MMIDKRLIRTVPDSKRYIMANVAMQWCALAANIAMMAAFCRLLERLYLGRCATADLALTAVVALAAVAVRFGCHLGTSAAKTSALPIPRTVRCSGVWTSPCPGAALWRWPIWAARCKTPLRQATACWICWRNPLPCRM